MNCDLPLDGIGFAVRWDGAPRARQDAAALVGHPGPETTEVVSSRTGLAALATCSARRAQRTGPGLAHENDVMAVVDGRLDSLDQLRQAVDLGPSAGPARVLIAAYARWEESLLSHLRGEFAFILWDDRRRRLLAARDPFGVRLLHHVESPGRLWIATESSQFVSAGLIPGVPDDVSVTQFLMRDFRSHDRSFFRGVHRLREGHGLAATDQGVRTFDYRVVPSENRSFASRDECYAVFRETLETAVRRRLRGSTAVIADLSGGYDSSSIVCVADRLLAHATDRMPRVIAASAVFPGLACDETAYIDAVAEQVRMRIPVEKWDGTRATPDEFSDTVLAAPGVRMSITGGTDGYVQIARKHDADAVLSGLGGDHVGMPLAGALDSLAAGRWRAGLRSAFPPGISPFQAAQHALRIVEAFLPSWSPRLRPILRRLRPRRVPAWLAETARAAAALREPEGGGARGVYASHGQQARWMFLRKADLGFAIEMRQRRAAQFALDVRFPFLDWDLVALALAIPMTYWPRGNEISRLHGEALREVLPSKVHGRHSKGEFTSAVVNAAVVQLPVFEQMFADPGWASGKYVEQTTARALLNRFRDFQMTRDLASAYRLRAIAALEAWLRKISRYSSSRSTHED